MERERLGSRLGFILLSAGCAIGIGNVWKFPYMVGQNGGGLFVLIYLFFLIILGVPVMTIEFAVGRASQKSPARMYQALARKGTGWHIHGKAAVVGNYILMAFYTSVAAWMLQYFFKTAKGDFVGLTPDGVGAAFNDMLGNAPVMVIFVAIVVILGFLVCSFGLQKGLERITKFMMIALLMIMIVLAINSVFMEGGKEGLTFYLKPDPSKIKEIGLGKVIVGAMNQAFFTLSLGIGAMEIFGSYIGKDRALMGEAVNVAVLDTFVAIVSGLIIFPACFTYDVEPGAGPGLIFVTLPNIFNNMPLGRLWGSLFFIFMTFAAFSTVLAVFENIICCFSEITGVSRKKSSYINMALMFVLSLPCIFGYNILSGITPFGEGSTIMDLEDFIVSNILLPAGSLTFVLFIASKKFGWGWDNFTAEANTGKGLKVKNWMKYYVKFILPIIIAALLVFGLIDFFKK